ncbi:hypothetical protein AQUCO_01700084v1 [Aquilegia coerulea]|uniref:G-protein coupled receptors family 1 profile domain-containing protein n=1 Tax=Aquilegia coerulea TaxID=218851 RepID=A0A2G5DL42_AQUCA|nr:hypothetical protein AQUCO_01700084v1 [Aquilegia coerulea]
MPLTRLIADAFGVVTVCLVSLFVLLGLFCILYSVYFRYRIKRQGYSQLRFFNKPWIIRITFVVFTIWWGLGEVLRLSLLRHQESLVHALDIQWQQAICKFYIISNLGFTEPCLFLTILFLLHASLKQRDFGASCQRFNGKTALYVLLYCLPMFALQLTIVFAGEKITNGKMPPYFTSTSFRSVTDDQIDNAVCTYPLLSTILHGLYTTLLSLCLLWLGRQMLSSVINKGLRKRVFFLISCVSVFFPLRVLLLGLSVLSSPGRFLFEALVFAAFLVLLSCAGLAICMLVYCPVADSLALKGPHDMETGRRPIENHHDAVSLVGNQSLLEVSSTTSAGRNSDEDSTKRGSISFRTMLKDGSPTEVYEELSLLSPPTHSLSSLPGSPSLPGQLMYSPNQISNY